VKVLLDSCVWRGARDALDAAGHEVVHTASWPSDPGDEAILRVAHAEQRVLVTLDGDVGLLAVVRGEPHSGIVRLVDIGARDQGPATVAVLAQYGDELAAGAIVTVEPTRVRVRPA
jgi:predicted nuclease of predicted toxin-antitoxin system